MGLAGKWYNELHSEMEITVSGETITGTYKSGVGAKGVYPLTGAIDPTPLANSDQMLGFVVAWHNQDSNYNSVTAWSGRYLRTNTEETLVMFWLLSQKEPPQSQWAGTLIGEDVFTRTPPSEETKQKRLARGAFPFPTQ